MTYTELRLCVGWLNCKIAYNRCNPDIGMGPSPRMLLDDLCREANLRFTPMEMVQVLEEQERLSRP